MCPPSILMIALAACGGASGVRSVTCYATALVLSSNQAMVTRSYQEVVPVELSLQGRVAVVSGASKGIGRAIATELAREGTDVAICSRTAADLEAVAGDIRGATGRRVLPVAADLATAEGVRHLVRQTVDAFGRVDILVNNAGATQRGNFLTLGDDVWASGFALKHMGYVRLSRALWPHLSRDGRGRVVNIIGGAGRTPSADFMIGGGVNAALMNFTKALALQGAPERILVNGISPGNIRTERYAGRLQQAAAEGGISVEDAEQRLLASQPLGRIGSPEDIAALVAFLCSDRATFIHGTIITVDGGVTACI